MNTFRCIPMNSETAARLRSTRRDDRGGPVQSRIVDRPGFPCRHCQRRGVRGEEMLLASWDLPLPQGPYWTPSPVFLHARDCPRAVLEDVLPETVTACDLVSLRHYDAAAMCLYDLGVVLAGSEAGAVLRARIGDPRVAYVNVHSALPGCWLLRVERS